MIPMTLGSTKNVSTFPRNVSVIRGLVCEAVVTCSEGVLGLDTPFFQQFEAFSCESIQRQRAELLEKIVHG